MVWELTPVGALILLSDTKSTWLSPSLIPKNTMSNINTIV